MKNNTEKTNAMRILDQKKINYTTHTYINSEAISGIEVASVLNQDPNKVFKTLVTVAASKINYVFVIPVNQELDLKKAAKSVKGKSSLDLTILILFSLTDFAAFFKSNSWLTGITKT